MVNEQRAPERIGGIDAWRCPSCKTLAISAPTSGRCGACGERDWSIPPCVACGSPHHVDCGQQ